MHVDYNFGSGFYVIVKDLDQGDDSQQMVHLEDHQDIIGLQWRIIGRFNKAAVGLKFEQDQEIDLTSRAEYDMRFTTYGIKTGSCISVIFQPVPSESGVSESMNKELEALKMKQKNGAQMNFVKY